jgi:hypothetical protein
MRRVRQLDYARGHQRRPGTSSRRVPHPASGGAIGDVARQAIALNLGARTKVVGHEGVYVIRN